MMRKQFVILAIVTVIACLCTYAYRVQCEQRAIADRIIRLHVVANSDSEQDQMRKLSVRDALLPRIAELTADCSNRKEAQQVLTRALPALQTLAQKTLSDLDCADPVTVSLTTELFPRRDYETFSLPAGQYCSLRVSIGSAAGHNWWCVVFPSLCLPATSEELIETASTSGMSSEQTDLITGDEMTVELKFRLLDWFCELFG